MRATQQTFRRARRMRGDLSRAELRLWLRLRGRALEGLKFRNQHPIGHYILDFYCPAARLAVEVDGRSHDIPEQVTHDYWRDAWLVKQGIQVLRVRDDEVFADVERVLAVIADAARGRVQDHRPRYSGGSGGG
jgi:very-short-patch-repair endonuclease